MVNREYVIIMGTKSPTFGFLPYGHANGFGPTGDLVVRNKDFLFRTPKGTVVYNPKVGPQVVLVLVPCGVWPGVALWMVLGSWSKSVSCVLRGWSTQGAMGHW